MGSATKAVSIDAAHVSINHAVAEWGHNVSVIGHAQVGQEGGIGGRIWSAVGMARASSEP